MDVPLIERLAAFCTANPRRAFFNPSADEAAISTVEEAIKNRLPDSYRAFLRRFNGGFINIILLEEDYGPGHELWDLPTARWNSHHLFGLEEIIKAHRDLANHSGFVQFIPFCRTCSGETLVFGPSSPGIEPPVLDAFHEFEDPSLWGTLYPSFIHLLRAYLDGEGHIDTISG